MILSSTDEDEDDLLHSNVRRYSSSDESSNSDNDEEDNDTSEHQSNNDDNNQSFQSSNYGAMEEDDEDDDDSDDEDEGDMNNTSLYSSTSTWMTHSRLSSSNLDDSAMPDNSMMQDSDNQDDNNGNDDDERLSSFSTAPRGKVFIRSKIHSNDNDDNDISENKNRMEIDNNEANKIMVSNNHLNGKPLSLSVKHDQSDESSSDDELLVSHKTKVTPAKPTPKPKRKKPGPKPKKKPIDEKPKKRKRPGPKPKKKPNEGKKASHTSTIVDYDDDAIEAVALVNGDGERNDSDSDTVEALVEAVVIPQKPPKRKRKKPGPKPKKKPIDEKGSSKSNGSDGKKRRLSIDNESDSEELCYEASIIPSERLKAAESAREILMNSVQRLPLLMSDTHSVRSFGRLKIEKGTNALDTLYSNATALYPVGFSCDRYEFSPVHGRILKLRCDIVEGKCEDKSIKNNSKGEKKEVDLEENCKDQRNVQKVGPIFRIMWGRGIDELDDGQSFPFDLYSACAPLGNEVDAVAIPLGKDAVKIKPEQGMRVKVNFENDAWYFGTILQVSEKKELDSAKKKTATRGAVAKNEKKQKFRVQILYDDGVKEEITYPDPDIILVPPGSNDIGEDCDLNTTEVKGKSVTVVTGTSPIDAWAQALIKIGLIDEIILEQAVQSIADAHADGLAELKGKSVAVKKQKSEGKLKIAEMPETNSEVNSNTKFNEIMDIDQSKCIKTTQEASEVCKKDDKERQLKQRLENLLKDYENKLSESRKIAMSLAEARIEVLGPYLSNPFLDSDINLSQQKQWLATIIKKEKSKIGSTGNKRKIVTATDLLERTATFYNVDIERLIEGLPASEFCPAYVFHELRGSGSSTLHLIHEEQMRQEREEKKKRRRLEEEKLQAELKREVELKKKLKEEKEKLRKQKMEEIDQAKKEREQNRLTRLTSQIDEKLFKESCLQRERITFLATKLVGKEISRRRKAAEVVVGYAIGNTAEALEYRCRSAPHLSDLSKCFNAGVVRLWNFLTSYRGAFDEKDHCLPGLEELQEAINCIDNSESERSSRKKAIEMLTNIAIAFCKPMTKLLIRTLSSALNTTLQDNNKDEGESNVSSSSNNDPDSFPIDMYTWREFARLILQSEALNDLGYTKVEQAHILRGHRTGGHPNSKEAKRVKRGEDYALVLRRQTLAEITTEGACNALSIKISVPTPSNPSSQPSDWLFFLHNIKSLSSNAATTMKTNLKKACSLLKISQTDFVTQEVLNKTAMIADMERNISLLEEIGTSITSTSETIATCKKVRDNIVKMLDNCTGEVFSVNSTAEAAIQDSEITSIKDNYMSKNKDLKRSNATRLKAGLYGKLSITEESYKQFKALKQKYISLAIKVSEERERKKKRAEEGNEDDDDDDDDDEEEDEENGGEPQDMKNESEINSDDEERIGKKTDYDDFCADEPKAPEYIRRCLAVLRSLCMTSPAENFIYPVDPRSNMKYYDAIIKPMSLYDVGKILQREAKRLRGKSNDDTDVEDVVAEFGRNVRLICQNCTVYSAVSAAIISTAEEMIRIFERLFFDWVLSPANIRPNLEMLDDERCVEFHSSDEDAMVLLCDGCEGKFNMSRLNPPLLAVPKGDWYCPRCRSGYCWASVDCRIGRKVLSGKNTHGIIKSCISMNPDDNNEKATLCYVVGYANGDEEIWSLDAVDKALCSMGEPVPKICCVEAVSESPGYGCGINTGLNVEAVPVPLNPLVSDGAAQQAIKSTAFQDMVISSASLLVNDVDALTGSEWLKILILLSMKCASTDKLQEFTNNIEAEANSKATSIVSAEATVKSINEIIAKVTDDEFEEDQDSSKPNFNSYKCDKSVTDTDCILGEAAQNPVCNLEISNDDEIVANQKRKEVVHAMRERQKARENSFLACCIKAQLKTGIASFEEDNVTQIINSYLSSNKLDGVDLVSSRCKALKCDFCGLSDMALATPLVRVPNHEEWLERMSFHCSGHDSYLIADLDPSLSSKENCSQDKNVITDSISSTDIHNPDTKKAKRSKLVTVTVRVDGDIISTKDNNPALNENDAGIVNFLPVNEKGFQSELKSHYDDKLPFVTGSLVAHECCALVAHKSRIDRVVQDDKENTVSIIERDFGSTCGRTLSLGHDAGGRWYWKLHSQPDSLFVSVEDDKKNLTFKRFDSPELIASVIKGLGMKSNLALEIQKAFPQVSEVLSNRLWSALIMREKYKHIFDGSDESNKEQKQNKVNDTTSSDRLESFNQGEEVLVESSSGKLLWNAHIVGISKDKEGVVTGYRVHYKEWSSRFDEWVEPKRIVEPNEHNLYSQEELSNAHFTKSTCPPISLDNLEAKKYLDSPNRAVKFSTVYNFHKIMNTVDTSSSDEETLGLLRCAVLIVEAALPMGSVDTSDNGAWKPAYSAYWRKLVINSKTPGSLMGCIILLESILSKDWIRPNCEHLMACLSKPWKAINDATVSSIALRLWVLDRGIKYALVHDEDNEWKTIDDDDYDDEMEEEEEVFDDEDEG